MIYVLENDIKNIQLNKLYRIIADINDDSVSNVKRVLNYAINCIDNKLVTFSPVTFKNAISYFYTNYKTFYQENLMDTTTIF